MKVDDEVRIENDVCLITLLIYRLQSDALVGSPRENGFGLRLLLDSTPALRTRVIGFCKLLERLGTEATSVLNDISETERNNAMEMDLNLHHE